MKTGHSGIEPWQRRMFGLLWTTYASYYLLRVNIAVAVPDITREFSLSKTAIGSVMGTQFFLYALGQLINGQVGDRLNARLMVALGLLASVACNVAFGFGSGVLFAMTVIWGLNGYFQSMGWGPTVKALSNWFPADRRTVMSGRLATSYILGGAISWFLAGSIIATLGWRFVFWIPAMFCLLVALRWFFRARNAPEEVGLPSVEEQRTGRDNALVRKDRYIGLRTTLKISFSNPYVWLTAFGLFGLNIIRYGFMDWVPTYIFETRHLSVTRAAYEALVFPLAGALGAIFAGWASNRYFNNRKAALAAGMLFFLPAACLLYATLYGRSRFLDLTLLGVVGFLTFGPHTLMVTALPADLGTRKAASSVTGFIDAFGYLGAGLTGVGSGFLVERISWASAFSFWLSGSIFAAGAMLFVARREKGRGEIRLA